MPVAPGKMASTFLPRGCTRYRPYAGVMSAFQRTAPVAAFQSMTVPVAGVVPTVITSEPVTIGVVYGSECVPDTDQRTLPVVRLAR